MVISVTILIEAIVEYIKNIFKMFTEKNYKTATVQIFAIVVSVTVCLLTEVNLFEGLAFVKSKAFGTVISGIIISRGSNYVSDLLSKLK